MPKQEKRGNISVYVSQKFALSMVIFNKTIFHVCIEFGRQAELFKPRLKNVDEAKFYGIITIINEMKFSAWEI